MAKNEIPPQFASFFREQRILSPIKLEFVDKGMSRLASTSRLSLEDWEALSPLTESENESICRIQLASNEKPIPSRVRRF